MASDNESKMSDDYAVDDVSLESILAEFKGSAYINGDKKTPKDLLNDQTERILKEALGGSAPDTLMDSINAAREQESDFEEIEAQDVYEEKPVDAAPVWTDDAYEEKHDEAQIAPIENLHDDRQPSVTEASVDDEGLEPLEDKDSVVMFFDSYRAPQPKTEDEIIKDVEVAIEKELGYVDDPNDGTPLSFGIVERPGIGEEELVADYEDDFYEEPDLKDAMKRFVESYSSISLRVLPAIIITILMIVFTFAAEAGLVMPFGIGHSLFVATGALVIMLLVVMMLCVDIIIRGAGDLVRGAPNVETLILFSCVFSLISAAFTMFRGGVASILPYCAVSAVSVTLAAYGEKLSLRAIVETLKTAVSSSEPYGVQAEYNSELDKSVLKKAYNRTDGFYFNLMHPDVSETAYRYAAPILLACALIMAVLTVVVKGRGEYFLHTLSALLAAAAPFSAMLTFAVPFGIVSRSIRKSGAAIAGWGGVDDMSFTDGTSVTDDDLFPPGTLSFNGVKIYEGVPPQKAIRYTASLIMASGSGLSRIFSEVLRTQKMDAIRVYYFKCYEGGVGARINGEMVMTGSAAFMNLLSIRIPEEMNMRNAVFTAIDNKLVALFAVEYLPVNSVQGALISMLKWRIKLFFTMRDFNITPLMLEQKFRVSLEDIEYVQAKDSYSISDSFSGSRGRMAALLAREGLGPYAEAITGGRLLRSASLVATAVSLVSAALGVVFMFFMFWNGSFLSAKPGNLLIFMLSTLAAVLVVCIYVKCKK